MVYSCHVELSAKMFISDLTSQIRYHEIKIELHGHCPNSHASSVREVPVVEWGVRRYLTRNLDTQVDKVS